jgi:hypothetical protein
MSFFGSRRRSTCVRLVLSSVAILALERRNLSTLVARPWRDSSSPKCIRERLYFASVSGHTLRPAPGAAFHSWPSNVPRNTSSPIDSCHVSADASCMAS